MAKFHPRLARKRQKAFAAAAASAAAATSANPTTTKLLTQIAVAQINLKGSAKRIRKLRTCVEGLDTPWDVIAIQDPPREIAWANMPGYRVWYQTDRELSLQDRFPTSPLRQRSKRGSTQPATPEAIFMKVAFYIKDHIHESSWEAVPVPGLGQLAASLRIKKPDGFGRLVIHNVYNHKRTLDLKMLKTHCMGQSDILVGDFNMRARLWGGESADRDPSGEALATMTQRQGMRCLNEKGVVTWSRSADADSDRSVIDLAFAGSLLTQQFLDWQVHDGNWFNSDHRIVVSRFRMRLELSIPPPRTVVDWKRVDKDKYNKRMTEVLSVLGSLPLESKKHIDAFIQEFLRLMDANLPRRRHWNIRQRTADKLEALVLKAFEEYKERLREGQDPANDKVYTDFDMETILDSIRCKFRRSGWRKYVAVRIALKGPMAIFKLDKLVGRWNTPRIVPSPYLKDPEPYMRETFYKVSEADEPSPPLKTCEALPRSPRSPEDEDVNMSPPPTTSSSAADPSCPPCSQGPSSTADMWVRKLLDGKAPPLEGGELEKVVSDLKMNKSWHPDGVGNEAYRFAAGAVVPHMRRLFDACFAHAYHPSAFRAAKTVLLKKPGKSDYNTAKAWRPVALLSCLGKILEKLVANRMSTVASYLELFDQTQFASEGRSTTMALEYIFSIVYRGWCAGLHSKVEKDGEVSGSHPKNDRALKRKVSLLSLDLDGAFNRVHRQKLLRVLRAAGMPSWVLGFIHSFLSDRSTTLSAPGLESKPYWVHVGVPQGSPISPILFAIFVSSLIKELSESRVLDGTGIEKYPFGYVDDHGILFISESFQKNCLGMEKLHLVLLDWATRYDMVFSQEKYAVMHFDPRWQYETKALKEKRNTERKSPTHHCTTLPDIAGLPKDAAKGVLRILGVQVHHKLKWDAHIDEMEWKINAVIGSWRGIQGSVWGATMKSMRALFLSKVRPKMTYACAAWFMPDYKYGFSQALLQTLRKIEYACLVRVTGAFRGTPYWALLKELNIVPIEFVLRRMSAAHRARNIGTTFDDQLTAIRTAPLTFGPSRCATRKSHQVALKAHPFHSLYAEAKQALTDATSHASRPGQGEEGTATAPTPTTSTISASSSKARPDRSTHKDAIAKWTRRLATADAAAEWEKHRLAKKLTGPSAGSRLRAAGCEYRELVYAEPWGKLGLKHYAKLDRGQSTMLLQCRTGHIGLNSFLHRRNMAPSSVCPRCNNGQHTVRHLFLECTALNDERAQLRRELVPKHQLRRKTAHEAQPGHEAKLKRKLGNQVQLNLRLLLTKQSSVATRWAIRHFGLEQFQWPKSDLEESDLEE